MNSTVGLHVACQAATAKFLHQSALCPEPTPECDSYESVENKCPFTQRNQNHPNLPAACAVETDADRLFFMQILEEIYTPAPRPLCSSQGNARAIFRNPDD
jgi:hypothetical protein